MPTTRPRRAENQRAAMVAPSTRAVSPVPKPTTKPHSNSSCHSCVMASDTAMPATTINSEASVTLRRP